jgi:hypothetical protein
MDIKSGNLYYYLSMRPWYVRLKTGSLDLKTGSLHRTETTFGRFGPLGLVLKQRLGLWATPTLIEQIWTLTEQKKKESPTPIHRNLDDHDYDTYSATIRFQKEIWTTTKSGCINKTILPPPEIQFRPEKHFHRRYNFDQKNNFLSLPSDDLTATTSV